jgi:hypothetical protein
MVAGAQGLANDDRLGRCPVVGVLRSAASVPFSVFAFGDGCCPRVPMDACCWGTTSVCPMLIRALTRARCAARMRV